MLEGAFSNSCCTCTRLFAVLTRAFCCTCTRLWARQRRPRIHPRKRKQDGRSTAPPDPPNLSGPPAGGPRPSLSASRIPAELDRCCGTGRPRLLCTRSISRTPAEPDRRCSRPCLDPPWPYARPRQSLADRQNRATRIRHARQYRLDTRAPSGQSGLLAETSPAAVKSSVQSHLNQYSGGVCPPERPT